ncbi:MAG: carbamoyl-phosphate synthase large subunit, partial [Oscillospiraceae bacterium]
MPKNPNIKKTLVIGSGPIVIGQAAEFDYSGTQACLALRENNIEVVLINSNPATIMTDSNIADKIYIEPITVEVVERIISLERPDSVLPTLGGQTGLNTAMELAESGVFEKYGVELLGACPETIKKSEDRGAFKECMESINEPLIPSVVVTNVQSAVDFANIIGYPIVVRPAYTLGGSGGGIVYDEPELRELCDGAIKLSRVGQTLIEKCISGWKEIEFEVLRDNLNNEIIVCGMENVDPVGIHTGDSIVVAPCQTLSDEEYKMLKTSALNIVSALGICGACNVQLALKPNSFEYAVIEVNPRVSRSSALASKATGYPIAKIASKIAIGYTLEELQKTAVQNALACYEPAMDYCVVKFPRFPFDKFIYAKKTLGTQMQATGEVMSIGSSFEQALMKAVRSVEKKTDTLTIEIFTRLSDEELISAIKECDDDRLFQIYEALRRGISMDTIYDITKIDYFFLQKMQNILAVENRLKEGNIDEETYQKALDFGFINTAIERLSGEKLKNPRLAAYKSVDTCAAEFESYSPYFYSNYDKPADTVKSEKSRVLVIGSGPIRIGQGIEFDYCTVHSVWALREAGYEAIIANNNPETVSTDFDTADRLYFDPLTPDDIDNVIARENPDGVIVQFGGQTAIKLAKHLDEKGVKILGTSFAMIDAAEDRRLFDAILEKCQIPRPEGMSVFT